MTDVTRSIELGRAALDAARFSHAGRHQYLNSSEADSCIRQQWYKKHAKKPEPSNGFAWRGHTIEKYVVAALRAANVPLFRAGDEQVTLRDKKSRISATPDGYILHDGDAAAQVIEIKSIDPRTNKAKSLPRSGHVTQVQIGMALLEQDGIKVKDAGLLMYVDASNYDDILYFDVPRDKDILKKYAKRADRVLNARKASTLNREGKTRGGTECGYCAYSDICLGDSTAGTKTKSRGRKDSVIAASVSQYLTLKDQEATVKASLSAVSEEIKEELRKRKTKAHDVGGVHVALASVKGRKKVDTIAMAKDGIDIEAYTTIGKASERLTVTKDE